MSVVDASTLPDGLINTTTTFGIPTLEASKARPLIFITDRRREAFARNPSSEDTGSLPDEVDSVGVGDGAAVGSAVGVAGASGDGDGAFSGVGVPDSGLVSEGEGSGVG